MEQPNPFAALQAQVADMARAFAGWPTDHQAPEDPEAFHARPPVQVIARRRAANKRARATRQAQRRG